MSEERTHRRRGGAGAGRWLTIGGWVVAAALAVHLALGMLRSGAKPGEGVLPERAYYAIAFWVPLAALAAASVAGVWWSARSYARREKSSVLWMRHAFSFGVVAALLLVFATFQDAKRFRREWFAAAVVTIAAVQMALFAAAAFREHRRSTGHGRRDEEEGE